MKKAIFTKPSTFTYIGRHASGLKFLLSRAKRKNEILDIGPGPFEPFTIAAHSPDSRITVIEKDPKILGFIRAIDDGVTLPLYEMGMHCCNYEQDGYRRSNRNLNDPRQVQKGFEELWAAGLKRYNFIYDHYENFGFRGRADILTMEPMDITTATAWKQFDIVFVGLVLLNLRKILSNEEFERAINNILSFTKKDGTLGIGTTPAGIHGKRAYLPDFIRIARSKGFVLQELFIDNIVRAKARELQGRLHGGYLATFCDEWDSPVDSQHVRENISNEAILRGAKIKCMLLPLEQFLEYLQSDNLLLLSALHTGGDHYHVAFAELDSIFLPRERYQFNITPSIK
jgi:hypothetical protein